MSPLTGGVIARRWRRYRAGRTGSYRVLIHCREHEVDLAAVQRFVDDGKPASDQAAIGAIANGECPACRPRYVAGRDESGDPYGATLPDGLPAVEAKGGYYVSCGCCRTSWELEEPGWMATVKGGLQISGERRPIPAGKSIDSSFFVVDAVDPEKGAEEALRRGFLAFDASSDQPAMDDLVDDVTEAMLAANGGKADERAELARIKLEHRLDDALADRWQFVALSALAVIRGLKRGERPPGRRSSSEGAALGTTRERFEELVASALDSIPPELGSLIENVAVLVEAEAESRDLFGLYQGVPLTAWGRDGRVSPDRITIYQDTISKYCRSEDEIVAQVRRTVIHEVGHHFGIDDRRLRELGW